MRTLDQNVKKHNIWTAVILTLMVIVMIILSFIMVNESETVIVHETQRYLSELSKQTSMMVKQNVNHNLTTLSKVSQNLSNLADDDEIGEKIVNTELKDSGFRWIGFVDKKGNLHAEGKKAISMASYNVVEQALHHQQSGVSSRLVNLFGEEGILYATPFYRNNIQYGAMVAWSSPDSMRLLFDTDTFNGTGFSYIISANGDFILHSSNASAVFKKDNFYDSITSVANINKGSSLNKMKEDVLVHKSGLIRYTVEKNSQGEEEDRTLYYTPLQDGNWYLLSIAPSTIYTNNISHFTNFSVMINVFIFVMFMMLITYILINSTKTRKRISQIAYVDPITKGYTSPRFEMELEKRLQDFQPFTFLSLDIRKFKLINDSFGSEEGDRVLRYVYTCLKEDLQEGELIARIFADKYNLVWNTTNPDEVIQRIQLCAEKINDFNQQREAFYYLPLDCGAYIVQDKESDIVSMRDRSNTARKNTKADVEQHIYSCSFYNDMDRLFMLKEKEMENTMETALYNDEFVVYLQPKVDLIKNEVVGAEALVRWNSPIRGMIGPNEFIPFFERNGFIIRLDLYVFEQVCKQLRTWMEKGQKLIPISINVSRNHLFDRNFLDAYELIQQKYKVPAHYLEFELTENVVFENLELLKNVIANMHKAGFQCSMDDFGSGYSSLNVLKEIPVDILKLDRAFFDKEDNPRGNDVVEIAIELAQRLGMKTVAEGVETISQVEFLRQADCDMIQGYVFYKPMSIENFEKMMAEKEAAS